jgi:hypothetical protein
MACAIDTDGTINIIDATFSQKANG